MNEDSAARLMNTGKQRSSKKRVSGKKKVTSLIRDGRKQMWQKMKEKSGI